MPSLLSSRDAGRYLGVSDDFIRKQVKAGELACHHFGKLLRFSEADLDDFASRQRVPAVVVPPATRPKIASQVSDAAREAFRRGDYRAFAAATGR